MLRRSVVAICIVSSPVGLWLRTAGGTLSSVHSPPASRPISDSLRRAARKGKPRRRVSLRWSCGTGFGFGSIGVLTRRARGTDFWNCGRGSGEVVTNFSAGRERADCTAVGAIGGARSRGRYTWLRWRSARCERLDCGGNDGARDRPAQTVDDEGVTGQNSVFGPDDAVSRNEECCRRSFPDPQIVPPPCREGRSL